MLNEVGAFWVLFSLSLYVVSCLLQNLTPYEFVESMKKKGIRVPGIGHRYLTIFFQIVEDCWEGVPAN